MDRCLQGRPHHEWIWTRSSWRTATRVRQTRRSGSLTVPADASAAVLANAENAKIAAYNDANKLERESITREYKSRLGAKISKALKPKARLRLDTLKNGNKLTMPDGTVIENAYDGKGMWDALEKLKGDDDGEGVGKERQRRVEQIRDTQLPDNVSPQGFADVLVEFNELNELIDNPYKKEAYSKFVLNILPDTLDADRRMLKRELIAATKFDDHEHVVQKVKALIAEAYKPNAQPMMKLTVAAHEQMLKESKQATARAVREAIAAVTAGRKPNDKADDKEETSNRQLKKAEWQKKREDNRLPDGQTCSSGTCNRVHEGDCFKDARKRIGLPPRAYDNVRYRQSIEDARDKHGKSIGITPKELYRLDAPPKPTASLVPSDGSVSFDSNGTLTLLANSSCMLSPLSEGDHSEEQYPSDWGLGYPPGVLEQCGDVMDEDDEQREALFADDDGSGRVWCNCKTPESKSQSAKEEVTSLPIAETDNGAGVFGKEKLLASSEASAQSPKVLCDSGSTRSVENLVDSASTPPVGDDASVATESPLTSAKGEPASLVEGPAMWMPQSLGAIVHASLAIAVVLSLLVGAFTLISLMTGSPISAFASSAFLVCGCHGPDSVARAFNLDPMQCAMSPVHTRFRMVVTVVAMMASSLFFFWNNVYLTLVAQVVASYLQKAGRFVASGLVSPRVWMRNAQYIAGSLSVVCFVVLVLQGVMGATVDSPSVVKDTSLFSQALTISRNGMDLLPDVPGIAIRKSMNNLSLTLLDNVYMPHLVMNAGSDEDLARMGGVTGSKYRLLDSGSAFEVVRSTKDAIPGSIRKNTTSVSTANGIATPDWRCDVPMKVGMLDGTVRTVIRRDCLVMPKCAHELVSAGNIAKQHRIRTLIADNNETRLIFPDGKTAPVFNMGVTVLPIPEKDWASRAVALGSACASVVTQGGRHTRRVSSRIIHLRGNHAGHRTLNQWHKCSNAPKHWHVTDEPCDDCLQANSSAVPSDQRAPTASAPGDFMSFDVYDIGVPHVHGGHRKVFGVHDLYSKFNWVCLMHNESESEVLRCLKEFHTFMHAAKVTGRNLHTDNYTSYHTPAVKAYVRDTMQCRYTTSPPDTPRSNGTSERQWGVMGNDTRRLLNVSKLPRNFAWYALRHSVDVRNTLPLRDDPTQCPYKLFLKRTPNVMNLRVWGCMVYPKIMHTATKMANRSVPCIHLGRCPTQPGYLAYNPATGKVVSSIHCRFVESESPGLTVNARGGWIQATPSYSDDYDADADVVDGLGNPIGTPLAEDVSSREDPLVDEAVAQPAPPTPPTALRHATPLERPDASKRSRRLNTNPYATRGARPISTAMCKFALVTVAALVQGLQPGGEAFGTQVLGFGNDNPRPEGNFFIYLCSNKSREGDFEHHIRELSNAETMVVNIDIERGGHSHDLSTDHVTDQLVELASRPSCAGVLCTVPCNTWTAARMVGNKGPKPLRDSDHHFGIPDSTGEIPRHVQVANSIAINAIRICSAAVKRGAHCIIENPVSRGSRSQFAIKGRERHSSLWDFPPMIEFAQQHGMKVTAFDQCRLGASTQKTTQLLSSPSVHQYVNDTLGPLVCNHAPGEHAAIIGDVAADGQYKTKATGMFPSQLNRTLAQAMLRPHDRGKSGWIGSIGSVIGSYSNRLVGAFSYALVAAHMPETPPDDAVELLQNIRQMRMELGDDNEDWVNAAAETAVMEASRIAASVCANIDVKHSVGADAHLERLPQAYAFVGKVSKARHGGSDNPSYNAAMKSDERAFWFDACCKEMHSLSEHNVYEEVPEDSLPTWNHAKGKAGEVVDIM